MKLDFGGVFWWYNIVIQYMVLTLFRGLMDCSCCMCDVLRDWLTMAVECVMLKLVWFSFCLESKIKPQPVYMCWDVYIFFFFFNIQFPDCSLWNFNFWMHVGIRDEFSVNLLLLQLGIQLLEQGSLLNLNVQFLVT